MPKFNYVQNDGVKLVKRKNKPFKKSKTFLIFVFVLIVAIAITVASSGMLSLGQFSFSSLFSKNTVSVKKHKMYFYNVENLQTLTQAQEVAEVMNLQGASGYVWEHSKTEFWIVGNAYFSKTDAEKVHENNKGKVPKGFVSEIEFKPIKIKYDKYSKEQVKVIQNSLSFVNNVLNKLYEYSLSIDEQKLTPTTVSSFVNSLKSEAKIISVNLDVINSTVIYEETLKIKNSYVKIIDVLDELVLKLINSENVNHITKNGYVKIIDLKYQLYKNL